METWGSSRKCGKQDEALGQGSQHFRNNGLALCHSYHRDLEKKKKKKQHFFLLLLHYVDPYQGCSPQRLLGLTRGHISMEKLQKITKNYSQYKRLILRRYFKITFLKKIPRITKKTYFLSLTHFDYNRKDSSVSYM